MKKTGRAAALAVLLALLAGLLAGCGGEMTAEKLAQRMAKATRRAQITQLTLTSGLVLQLEGQQQETGLRTVVEMQLSAGSGEAYASVSAGTVGDGPRFSGDTQTWLLPQEDTLAAYTHTDSSGQWLLAEQPLPEGDGNGSLAFLAELDPALLELAPEQEEVNGTRVWRLTVWLTPEQLSEALGRAAGLQAAAGVLDWKGAGSIETVFYVSTRSGLPVRIEVQANGLGLPDALLAGIFSDAERQVLPGSARLHAYYDAISYNDKKLELPALPEQGRSSAVSAEELLESGALYAIEENGQQVLVRAPADWQAYGQGPDTVTLARPDGSLTVTYTMYTPDADRAFFASMIGEQELPPLQTGGGYLLHGDGPQIGGFETMWVECEEMMICYAWSRAGDACLYLRAVAVGQGLDAEAVLRPLLEQVGR